MIRFTRLVGDSRKVLPERRPVSEVMGFNIGASARGSTFWKRVRRCPREHALAAIGLRPGGEKSEALDVGLLFHHALETYFLQIQAHQHECERLAAQKQKKRTAIRNDDYYFGAIPEAEKAAWASIADFKVETGYEGTYARLEMMLLQYFENYRRRDRWRIIAVEETLVYDEVDFQYTARLDLIVECEDRGGMWIVEHKTAASITQDLLHNYQLDIQILGQVWLLKTVVDIEFYPPFRGVLVDIMTKPRTSKKTGKVSVPKFERLEVCPSRHHLDEFYNSMTQWSAMLPIYEKLGWPKVLGNCAGGVRYFKRCPYFDLCDGRPLATVAELAAEMEHAGAPSGFRLDENEHTEDDT